MKDISFSPLGDGAILIDFGDGISLDKNKHILAYHQSIIACPFPGFIEAVPAYTTLTVFYDPVAVGTEYPYKAVKQKLKDITTTAPLAAKVNSRTVDIPVCYEDLFALDLPYVAEYNNMNEQEVIKIHCNNIYHVFFLGFAPGFPFLGGMNKNISTPRKRSPRLKIPRGSVGIAGGQTGIYPLDSPGGWQIIGRTPIKLFDSTSNPPTLLLPGDKIRFVSISKQEYDALEEQQWPSK